MVNEGARDLMSLNTFAMCASFSANISRPPLKHGTPVVINNGHPVEQMRPQHCLGEKRVHPPRHRHVLSQFHQLFMLCSRGWPEGIGGDSDGGNKGDYNQEGKVF